MKKVRLPSNSWQRVPITDVNDRQTVLWSSRFTANQLRWKTPVSRAYDHGQPPLWKYCFNSGHEALRDGYYPGAASFRRSDAVHARCHEHRVIFNWASIAPLQGLNLERETRKICYADVRRRGLVCWAVRRSSMWNLYRCLLMPGEFCLFVL